MLRAKKHTNIYIHGFSDKSLSFFVYRYFYSLCLLFVVSFYSVCFMNLFSSFFVCVCSLCSFAVMIKYIIFAVEYLIMCCEVKRIRRYGFPYKGSKRVLADWLVWDVLPPGRVFVDLFAGGCSVTHAAMLSHRYGRYIANDLSGTSLLFRDAVLGCYADEDRWISREDFFALKDTDAYVRWLWSFGNDGRSYMYGRDVEPWKRAFHYAVFYRDVTPYSDMGISVPSVVLSDGDIVSRTSRLARYLRSVGVSGASCRLESSGRLQSLQSLHECKSFSGLEVSSCDYADVAIPDGAVVYCDIPYRGTNEYDRDGGFDHGRFYEWALSRPFPVYVSEYDMPEGFVCVAACSRIDTMCATDNTKRVAERVFVQSRYAGSCVTGLFGCSV